MLYILGGAARSGKSTIARRLVTEKAIPYFCTDAFINAIEDIEVVGVNHELPFIEKAEKLWPMMEPMMDGLLRDEPKYLLEGDGLLPKYVKSFVDSNPNEVVACFIGYPRVSVSDKFDEVRKYSIHQDDWTHKVTDEYLRSAISDMIEYSKYLQSECSDSSLQFIDVSDDFLGMLDKAYAYLTAK